MYKLLSIAVLIALPVMTLPALAKPMQQELEETKTEPTATAITEVSSAPSTASCPDWLNQPMKALHSNKTVDLCAITANKVTLFVNTASQCGFTPQFKQLEALYQRYKEQGLIIVGFPSDSFFQEHDDAEKTASVCYKNYGVSFPMVASSKVRGKKANAVFSHLGKEQVFPKWNFYKYLLGRDAEVIDYYVSSTKPLNSKLEEAVKKALALP